MVAERILCCGMRLRSVCGILNLVFTQFDRDEENYTPLANPNRHR